MMAMVMMPARQQNATGLTTTNITSGSATLNWVTSASPLQWKVQYQKLDRMKKWITITLAGSARSVNISSLSANQIYNWHISAMCGKKWTPYSGTVSFTTLAASSSSITSSIKAEPVNSTIKLYPNPSRGRFVVELHLAEKINVKATIQLMDMTGKTVYTENAVMINGTIQKTVTASSVWANGIYIVRIIVNNKIFLPIHTGPLYRLLLFG